MKDLNKCAYCETELEDGSNMIATTRDGVNLILTAGVCEDCERQFFPDDTELPSPIDVEEQMKLHRVVDLIALDESIPMEVKHDFIHRCAELLMVKMTKPQFKKEYEIIRSEAYVKFRVVL